MARICCALVLLGTILPSMVHGAAPARFERTHRSQNFDADLQAGFDALGPGVATAEVEGSTRVGHASSAEGNAGISVSGRLDTEHLDASGEYRADAGLMVHDVDLARYHEEGSFRLSVKDRELATRSLQDFEGRIVRAMSRSELDIDLTGRNWHVGLRDRLRLDVSDPVTGERILRLSTRINARLDQQGLRHILEIGIDLGDWHLHGGVEKEARLIKTASEHTLQATYKATFGVDVKSINIVHGAAQGLGSLGYHVRASDPPTGDWSQYGPIIGRMRVESMVAVIGCGPRQGAWLEVAYVDGGELAYGWVNRNVIDWAGDCLDRSLQTYELARRMGVF